MTRRGWKTKSEVTKKPVLIIDCVSYSYTERSVNRRSRLVRKIRSVQFQAKRDEEKDIQENWQAYVPDFKFQSSWNSKTSYLESREKIQKIVYSPRAVLFRRQRL